MLEDPAAVPPAGIYKMTRDLQQTEDYPSIIDINFEKGKLISFVNQWGVNYGTIGWLIIRIFISGLPVSVKIPSGHEKALLVTDALAIVETLNKLGGQHGIGRIDIVENRFLGLKVCPTYFWFVCDLSIYVL